MIATILLPAVRGILLPSPKVLCQTKLGTRREGFVVQYEVANYLRDTDVSGLLSERLKICNEISTNYVQVHKGTANTFHNLYDLYAYGRQGVGTRL